MCIESPASCCAVGVCSSPLFRHHKQIVIAPDTSMISNRQDRDTPPTTIGLAHDRGGDIRVCLLRDVSKKIKIKHTNESTAIRITQITPANHMYAVTGLPQKCTKGLSMVVLMPPKQHTPPTTFLAHPKTHGVEPVYGVARISNIQRSSFSWHVFLQRLKFA